MNKYFILLVFIFASHASLADQGITDTEILVGMHTDLNGPASMIGKQSVDGANMRFDEFNIKGGAHGRLIKFIVVCSVYQFIHVAIYTANLSQTCHKIITF